MKRTIELKQRLTELTDRENRITYYEDDDDDCSSDSDMEVVPQSSVDDLLVLQCLAKTTDNDVSNILYFLYPYVTTYRHIFRLESAVVAIVSPAIPSADKSPRTSRSPRSPKCLSYRSTSISITGKTITSRHLVFYREYSKWRILGGVTPEIRSTIFL